MCASSRGNSRGGEDSTVEAMSRAHGPELRLRNEARPPLPFLVGHGLVRRGAAAMVGGRARGNAGGERTAHGSRTTSRRQVTRISVRKISGAAASVDELLAGVSRFKLKLRARMRLPWRTAMERHFNG